jgi:UDP-N-acetylglucosamine acyltransferase
VIDPRAVIDPSARIGKNVTVGPFSIVGADVEIGEGSWIGPHAVIQGPTRIGRENRIYQFASIGEAPQDKKYAGEPTLLEIGDRNLFRESVTVHRGTVGGGGLTRIGNDNWVMAYCHIAHDCVVGNNTTFSNSASLAGHVLVDDHAILAGFTLVHQFCRIGAYSFCGFGSAVNRDVPPYMMVSGQMAAPHGINAEGLRRHGMSVETITALKRAYKVLYKSGLRLEEARLALQEMAAETPEIALLAGFIAQSQRGIVR